MAGSAAQNVTAAIEDVRPGVASGSEVPRVFSVERGVFLCPRKRRRKTSPQDPGGSEDDGRTKASATGGTCGPSVLSMDQMECEEISPHFQRTQERREEKKEKTPPPPSKILTPSGEKRGRGRPPTMWTFCGLAQYKRETRAAEKRAVREEARRDVEDFLEEVRRTRATNPLPDETSFENERARQSTEALIERTNLDCRALLQISKRSGNLKGTCQRGIAQLPQLGRRCFSSDRKIDLRSRNWRRRSEH